MSREEAYDALEYAKGCIDVLEFFKEVTPEIRGTINTAETMFNRGDYSASIEYARRASNLARERARKLAPYLKRGVEELSKQ